MLEKVGDKDIVVRNYTNNFDIKEYIQQELVPAAFPQIPMNKLNLGFTGVVSEYMSQAIEDVQGEASLMLNEAFITKAVLPSSIYADAAVYELGYRFATPSVCSFAIEIWLDDIINNAEPVSHTSTYRYVVDRDTKVVLGDNEYKFDYDINIDYNEGNNNRINVDNDDSHNNHININNNDEENNNQINVANEEENNNDINENSNFNNEGKN